jgi:hypothetical protein
VGCPKISAKPVGHQAKPYHLRNSQIAQETCSNLTNQPADMAILA